MLLFLMYVLIVNFFLHQLLVCSLLCFLLLFVGYLSSYTRSRHFLHIYRFLVFCRIGEYISLDLFYFVNLTTSCSLIPRVCHNSHGDFCNVSLSNLFTVVAEVLLVPLEDHREVDGLLVQVKVTPIWSIQECFCCQLQLFFHCLFNIRKILITLFQQFFHYLFNIRSILTLSLSHTLPSPLAVGWPPLLRNQLSKVP